MFINKLLLSTVLGVSILGTTAVSAEPVANDRIVHRPKQVHQHHRAGGVLTAQQRDQMRSIMKRLHKEMRPLIKEKNALKMQLRGKLATPKTQWSDIRDLVGKINETNAKINTLIVRTQLSTFQKLGVLLPLPPHHHFHGHHGRG